MLMCFTVASTRHVLSLGALDCLDLNMYIYTLATLQKERWSWTTECLDSAAFALDGTQPRNGRLACGLIDCKVVL